MRRLTSKAWRRAPRKLHKCCNGKNLLNTPGARESLVARWLFEHLFIAHIYFEGGEPGHFFQWVRSRTPSGQPIDLINTRRANDDPHAGVLPSVAGHKGIVHKTHITTLPVRRKRSGQGGLQR